MKTGFAKEPTAMIKLQCPACGRRMAAPDQWLGKRVKCPQCGKPVTVQPMAAPHTEAAEPETVEHRASVGSSAPSSTESTELPAHSTEASVFSQAGQIDPISPSESPEEPVSPSFQREQMESAAEEPQTIPLEPAAPTKHRLVAPAPPPNAVHAGEETVETVVDYDRIRARRGRIPKLIGFVAILVGLAGLGAAWVKPVAQYASFIAGGGVLLGCIGIAVAMIRRKRALPLPVIGTLVSVAAVVVPFVLLAVNGRSGHSLFKFQETDAGAAKPFAILRVDQLRATGKQDKLASEFEYKVTNQTGQDIAAVDGSIDVLDSKNQLVDRLLLRINRPVESNGSVSAKDYWPITPDAARLVAANQATLQYRARVVKYKNGLVDDFSQ